MEEQNRMDRWKQEQSHWRKTVRKGRERRGIRAGLGNWRRQRRIWSLRSFWHTQITSIGVSFPIFFYGLPVALLFAQFSSNYSVISECAVK